MDAADGGHRAGQDRTPRHLGGDPFKPIGINPSLRVRASSVAGFLAQQRYNRRWSNTRMRRTSRLSILTVLGLSLTVLPAVALDPGDANGVSGVTSADAQLIRDQLLGFAQSAGDPDGNSNDRVEVGDIVSVVNTVQSNNATFNAFDYFPIGANSSWAFVDVPPKGGGDTDGFSWVVQPNTITVAGNRQASRFKTIAKDAGDGRDQSEDYWYFEPNGDWLFCGFYQGEDIDGVPEQSIVLDDPLLVGRAGLLIGQTVSDDSDVEVETDFGDMDGNVASSVTYRRFVPSVRTPRGVFQNVLRMSVEFELTVDTPLGDFTVPVSESNFYLKKYVGLVWIDQSPDPDDAGLQMLNSGFVGGVAISPDAP